MRGTYINITFSQKELSLFWVKFISRDKIIIFLNTSMNGFNLLYIQIPHRMFIISVQCLLHPKSNTYSVSQLSSTGNKIFENLASSTTLLKRSDRGSWGEVTQTLHSSQFDFEFWMLHKNSYLGIGVVGASLSSKSFSMVRNSCSLCKAGMILSRSLIIFS